MFRCVLDSQSMEVAVQLGVDPRKPNQNIRGVVQVCRSRYSAAAPVFSRGVFHCHGLASLWNRCHICSCCFREGAGGCRGRSCWFVALARGTALLLRDVSECYTTPGAHIVGGEDLVERIMEGKIDFTTCIATPDMMPLVGRVARV